MNGESPGRTTPRRYSVADLTADQVQLLCTVLTASDVSHAVDRDQLITSDIHAGTVEKALLWVRLEQGDEVLDDPEYRGTHAPLVKPSRPPLADGRRQATRWRRLSAGLFDQVVLGGAAYLAWQVGAPVAVALAVLLLASLALSTSGTSPGKLLAGIRTVDARTLSTPSPFAALSRCLLGWAPLAVAMSVDKVGDLLPLLLVVVFSPVLLRLRGLHDYGAGTLVVEGTKSGPDGPFKPRRR